VASLATDWPTPNERFKHERVYLQLLGIEAISTQRNLKAALIAVCNAPRPEAPFAPKAEYAAVCGYQVESLEAHDGSPDARLGRVVSPHYPASGCGVGGKPAMRASILAPKPS
jgi:hypothetical protein